MAPPIPHIHLLCMESSFIAAFEAAAREYQLPVSVNYTVHHSSLRQLSPADAQFDLVVSPANSYGRLDGGFDDAISRSFAPRHDYHALTRAAQQVLYDEYRGFAPPGSCTLVEIPREFEDTQNVWGTRWLALCPTMRTPSDARWDREVVYECVWALLCAVDRHNRREGENATDRSIHRILMTPMATGCGAVSKERWAAQTVLAIRHFVDASTNPQGWSRPEWDEIEKQADQVEETWNGTAA